MMRLQFRHVSQRIPCDTNRKYKIEENLHKKAIEELRVEFRKLRIRLNGRRCFDKVSISHFLTPFVCSRLMWCVMPVSH